MKLCLSDAHGSCLSSDHAWTCTLIFVLFNICGLNPHMCLFLLQVLVQYSHAFLCRCWYYQFKFVLSLLESWFWSLSNHYFCIYQRIQDLASSWLLNHFNNWKDDKPSKPSIPRIVLAELVNSHHHVHHHLGTGGLRRYWQNTTKTTPDPEKRLLARHLPASPSSPQSRAAAFPAKSKSRA